MKEHPSIAPLIAGGELIEYSAHLIPEGGYDAMPELSGEGILIAGDAAGMYLAAGIWLEGVNYAIGSGMVAGELAAEAVAAHDPMTLGDYRRRLEATFVLADHRRLRHVPDLILSDRVQNRYPELACSLAEAVFTVTNPAPKPRIRSLATEMVAERGIRMRDLAADAWTAIRSFG